MRFTAKASVIQQKNYKYFISYHFLDNISNSRFGNIEIIRDAQIKSFEDLQEIKEVIEMHYKFKNVVIMNYQLLNLKSEWGRKQWMLEFMI